MIFLVLFYLNMFYFKYIFDFVSESTGVILDI